MINKELRYYSVPQVSRMLNVHENTVKRYIREGVLKGFKVNRRGDWRISETELDNFVKQMTSCILGEVA